MAANAAVGGKAATGTPSKESRKGGRKAGTATPHITAHCASSCLPGFQPS